MRIRLVTGPAGSGKTFRCLQEIRDALIAAPEGPPLLFITPKQTTYILERQILSDPLLAGYARLHILSFERLAEKTFEWLGLPAPKMLDEQGRLMVLRAILARSRDNLNLFRASARLTGFAQQLSEVLKEIQRKQLAPESLRELSAQVREVPSLSYKLADLAMLLEEYLAWLKAHQLHDVDCLLTTATAALAERCGLAANPPSQAGMQLDLFASKPRKRPVLFERFWLDGFAHLTEQQLDFLAALAPFGREGTMMFCLDRMIPEEISWLSTWAVVGKAYNESRKRLGKASGIELVTETLRRDPKNNRFAGNPVLQFLERHWAEPHNENSALAPPSEQNIRVTTCANPDAEVTLAAREIWRHVRAGGRFRDISVIVRKLAAYQQSVQRVFTRFQIPFFMDQREPVSHHPLPELTRNALRTITFGWLHEDWFAALKTGLAPALEGEIDKLENEALARGWSGMVWQQPITIQDETEMTAWLAGIHQRVMPPFQQLALSLGDPKGRVSGPQLGQALRDFWRSLGVEQKLKEWVAAEPVDPQSGAGGTMHETVWQQMNVLLENVELAFANESLSLREWLPILETGLGSLTVGVVPPSLDQVLVGAIDRSRNPEIKIAIVLGLNEGTFPAPPESSSLLSESDHTQLEKHGISLALNARHQLAQERFLAYIAFTRPRERLFITSSLQDNSGSSINPSPFLRHLTRMFPALPVNSSHGKSDWRESEHPAELFEKLLALPRDDIFEKQLSSTPALAAALERLRLFQQTNEENVLKPELAARLFGRQLRTSVSRLEQFAACPFQFFVRSGLRAEERKQFELDSREQGLFQHDVLALFHQHLRQQNRTWRDVTGEEARDLIGRLGAGLAASYRHGLLHATDRSKFMLRLMTASLQDFIETLVYWMQKQYCFDPLAVELAFGAEQPGKAWELELGNGHSLALQGRIDRLDVYQASSNSPAFCVVVDYKSGQKKLDPVFLANGLQLQLLAYLSVVRRWAALDQISGAANLIPAGVFYVSLRGQYDREQNRRQALSDTASAKKMAYRHAGRFNAEILRLLDSRTEVRLGDQFNYRLNQDGSLSRTCKEALPPEEFEALLDSIEEQLKEMGQRIYSGDIQVSPFKKGSLTACEYCAYQGICRIDPWTHSFRRLNRSPEERAT